MSCNNVMRMEKGGGDRQKVKEELDKDETGRKQEDFTECVKAYERGWENNQHVN